MHAGSGRSGLLRALVSRCIDAMQRSIAQRVAHRLRPHKPGFAQRRILAAVVDLFGMAHDDEGDFCGLLRTRCARTEHEDEQQ
jgi:hypothetical protein